MRYTHLQLHQELDIDARHRGSFGDLLGLLQLFVELVEEGLDAAPVVYVQLVLRAQGRGGRHSVSDCEESELRKAWR